MKKKRNYAAERLAAGRYANDIMNGTIGSGLDVKKFTKLWGVVYNSYLNGYRAAQGKTSALNQQEK